MFVGVEWVSFGRYDRDNCDVLDLGRTANEKILNLFYFSYLVDARDYYHMCKLWLR